MRAARKASLHKALRAKSLHTSPAPHVIQAMSICVVLGVAAHPLQTSPGPCSGGFSIAAETRTCTYTFLQVAKAGKRQEGWAYNPQNIPQKATVAIKRRSSQKRHRTLGEGVPKAYESQLYSLL